MPQAISALRQPLVILLFAIQIYWVISHFFQKPQYFTWAPVQKLTFYRLRVELGPVVLTGREACKRYRFRLCGFDHHTPENVFDVIEQFESTYGKNDHAVVSAMYRVNGGEAHAWKLQRQ